MPGTSRTYIHYLRTRTSTSGIIAYSSTRARVRVRTEYQVLVGTYIPWYKLNSTSRICGETRRSLSIAVRIRTEQEYDNSYYRIFFFFGLAFIFI